MKSFLIKVFAAVNIVTGIIIFSCANSSKKNNAVFNIITIKTGKGTGSVEVADFNKDGFPDIAVANAEDSSITILPGNGKGEFAEASGSPFFANRFPNDIAIADFNKDGNPDLGIANTEVSFLTILPGEGSGKFLPLKGSPFKTGKSPSRVAIGILMAIVLMILL